MPIQPKLYVFLITQTVTATVAAQAAPIVQSNKGYTQSINVKLQHSSNRLQTAAEAVQSVVLTATHQR